jgi:tetratricopeptide (TPR) repeat protein
MAIQSLLSRAKKYQLGGRWGDAMLCFNAVLRENPSQTQAIFGTAEIAKQLGKYQIAYQLLCQVIQLNPRHAKAFECRGNLSQIMGRSQDAINDFSKCIILKRQTAGIYNSRGIAFAHLGNFDQAIADFSDAIDHESTLADAFYNRALAYRKKGKYASAIKDYTKTIYLKSDHFQAYNNRGLAHRELRQYSEAIIDFEKCTKINPSFHDAYWNAGLCLLAIGNYKKGWALYEHRWASSSFTSPHRNFSAPLWLGNDNLCGKTILIHSEQGFGDTIQFCRYVPLIEALRCNVILEVEAELLSLLNSISSSIQIIEKNATPPHFDFHCPLMSLPLAFGTLPESIPGNGAYLSVEQARAAWWRAKLGEKKRPRIGLSWRGNAAHPNDHNRSIQLYEILGELSQDLDWFCLQKDLSKDEKRLIKISNKIQCFSSVIGDFADTGALLTELDAILCVDTSVAHLGGALDTPVYLLLPYIADFRWQSEGTTTPWYQSLKLYRQGPDRGWREPLKNAQKAMVRDLLTPD